MTRRQRERKIDVSKLSDEEALELAKTLKTKLNSILKSAVDEANRYLGVYGMEVAVAFEVCPKTDTNLNKEETK